MERRDYTKVEHYSGLVHKTASLVVSDPDHPCEDDFDDVVQVLYVKVWKALIAYSGSRSNMPVNRFVFMCLRNQVKDLQKKRRRGELSLDGLLASTGFESDKTDIVARHLVEADPYAEVEAEPLLLPNTLTALEQAVTLALIDGYSQAEIREGTGVEKREMERTMRGIRVKLADWKPSAAEVVDIRVAA